MPRVICPNCGRAFQAASMENVECPRCHYRAGSPAPTAPAGMARPPNVVNAPTYSVVQPVPTIAPAPAYRHPQSTNGMAVASLVLGVVGLLLWPLSVVALTLGVAAMMQTKRTGQPGAGLAVAGIVLGGLVIVVGLLVLVLVFGFLFG